MGNHMKAMVLRRITDLSQNDTLKTKKIRGAKVLRIC
jgi:hypothetical protein